MAAPLPFSESELRLLQILLKRKVRFMRKEKMKKDARRKFPAKVSNACGRLVETKLAESEGSR